MIYKACKNHHCHYQNSLTVFSILLVFIVIEYIACSFRSDLPYSGEENSLQDLRIELRICHSENRSSNPREENPKIKLNEILHSNIFDLLISGLFEIINLLIKKIN